MVYICCSRYAFSQQIDCVYFIRFATWLTRIFSLFFSYKKRQNNWIKCVEIRNGYQRNAKCKQFQSQWLVRVIRLVMDGVHNMDSNELMTLIKRWKNTPIKIGKLERSTYFFQRNKWYKWWAKKRPNNEINWIKTNDKQRISQKNKRIIQF